MADYPQSDKLSAESDNIDLLIEFMEWLGEQDIHLCKFSDEEYANGRYYPISESGEALVKRFVGIDPAALEQERRAMLKALGG